MRQPTSKRSTVTRAPQRARYDIDTVHCILDAGFVCHVAFSSNDQPFVIPMVYAREGNSLFLHGATSSRLMSQLAKEVPISIAVTHVDGIVAARSAFHHSLNYQSVVALGKAQLVESRDEKMHASKIIVEHLLKGRWEECRQPNENELKATSFLKFPLDEVSAKVRTGPPVDDKEDMNFPTWAGVIPIQQIAMDPIQDPQQTKVHSKQSTQRYRTPLGTIEVVL